jgi:DNA-binding NtrC family response regulator
MPGQNGIKTLIQIKEKHPHLPVIIMTGMSSNELRQTTESLGAVEHLTKPFPMSSLRSKVENILSSQ